MPKRRPIAKIKVLLGPSGRKRKIRTECLKLAAVLCERLQQKGFKCTEPESVTQRRQTRIRQQSAASEFDCEFENDLSLLSTLTQELRQTICERGLFNENESVRFVAAVDEALINAYFHGNLEIDSKLRELDGNAYDELVNQRRQADPYRDRHIHVHARIAADQISITIRDDGSGFDQSHLPDPTDPENLERPYGRGILLMRAYTDAVRYNDVGNEVTLVKWTE